MPSGSDRDCQGAVPRGRRPSNAPTITDILDAAREEFAESGFDGAAVESICRRAKVSKQLLYYYFKSKSDLYSVILTEAAEGMSTIVESVDYSALPPREALALFIENLFNEYVKRPQIVKMTIDEAQHNFVHVGNTSPLIAILSKIIDEVLGVVLLRGCKSGVFRADVEADELFWIIFSLVTTWYAHSALVSLLSRSRLGGEMDARRWRENSIGFVLEAIASRT